MRIFPEFENHAGFQQTGGGHTVGISPKIGVPCPNAHNAHGHFFFSLQILPKCPKCPWAFWFPVLATTEFCPNAQKAHGHFRLYSGFCPNAHTAHDDRQFCKTSTLCPNAHIAHGHLVKAYRLCPNAYGHLAPTVVGIDIRPKCPKCPWAF